MTVLENALLYTKGFVVENQQRLDLFPGCPPIVPTLLSPICVPHPRVPLHYPFSIVIALGKKMTYYSLILLGKFTWELVLNGILNAMNLFI